MDKQKKRKKTKRKAAPKPLKFNRAFYILGIVFSVLIVLGLLASIPMLATKDQMGNYIFYIDGNECPYSVLSKSDLPGPFSFVGCQCIELSNDT